VLFELRCAWRGIRKARGFTAVILMTLALGIGANTTIFSIVHAMLIEPLPYRDADQLAFVWPRLGRARHSPLHDAPAAAFAISALVLTCIGIYGVIAYSVATRRHEFGVRRALGAGTLQVLREVLREGFSFTAIGCVIGVAGAALAGQFLENQLYGVHPRDPIAVSPMDALRAE